MNLLEHTHRLLAAGALGVALTTAAEALTSPYSENVVLFGLNPTVHWLKVVAAVIFVAGMLALARSSVALLGRVGTGAAAALGVGAAMGAIPYSVAEATLDGDLTAPAAEVWLEEAYTDQLAWISAVASVGLLLCLVGLVVLAVVVLRRRLLDRWRPVLSLAAIPVAILSGVLDATTTLPVPHPPTWIFLGLGIAYAVRLAPSPQTLAATTAPRKAVTVP